MHLQDEAKKKEEEEDGEVRLMKEYRAQLDAERAQKLARGINHAAKNLSSKG
jgi:ribosomal protein L7Ae-like RNA K-turn-binding protein